MQGCARTRCWMTCGCGMARSGWKSPTTKARRQCLRDAATLHRRGFTRNTRNLVSSSSAETPPVRHTSRVEGFGDRRMHLSALAYSVGRSRGLWVSERKPETISLIGTETHRGPKNFCGEHREGLGFQRGVDLLTQSLQVETRHSLRRQSSGPSLRVRRSCTRV